MLRAHSLSFAYALKPYWKSSSRLPAAGFGLPCMKVDPTSVLCCLISDGDCRFVTIGDSMHTYNNCLLFSFSCDYAASGVSCYT
jgi:hypothetical protein